MQRYETMEPIDCREHFKTEVRVMNVCFLSAACLSNTSPCIVALSPGIFIESQDSGMSWPLAALWERTSFRQEFQDDVVPRWGGFYLPDVKVDKSEFGEEINPFSTAVVFGSPPWKPTDEVDSAIQFRSEMRDKIKNILRICHWHGHQELVISSKFAGLPAREIASLFYELLVESGDAVGAFRRVIFALPTEEVPAKVICGFQEEFRCAERDGVPRTSWKDGKYLVPRSQPGQNLNIESELCLDVNLRDVKWNGVRGTRAHMFKAVLSSSREHQQWMQLPCGRIVLAAFPQLCLSAEKGHDGAHIHMWHKVEKNQHLQIWETLDDGIIALAHDRDLRLCISGTQPQEVLLCAGDTGTPLGWSISEAREVLSHSRDQAYTSQIAQRLQELESP